MADYSRSGSIVKMETVLPVTTVEIRGGPSTAPSVSSGENEKALEEQPIDAEDWKPTTHQLLIFITLSIISFMVALDANIIVTSLGGIVTSLEGTATQGFWVGTAYLLTSAVFMPFIAALSDIFGRPILLVIALCMFLIGTILCATAQNMGTLLVGRSIQGSGGGGIVVLSLVIFTDIVPLRFRPKWYGIVLAAWAFGNCLGPVLGGLIADHTTWRWVFYIMFPFCAFGLISVPWLLTLRPRTETLAQKLGRVDWVGGVVFIGSTTSFLMAISWGGTEFSWGSAQTIAPLVVGAAGIVATGFWEVYFAREPFLRPSLFWCVSTVATFSCGAIQGLLMFGQLYYVPLFFIAVKGFSATDTGAALLPVTVTLLPASIITGALVTKHNNYRSAIWIGWTLTVIGAVLPVVWSVRPDSTAIWVIALVVIGLGHGAVLNAQNFASQAQSRSGDEGAAAAMYAFLRQLGMALGVGIGGSCFQNVMALKLRWEGLPREIADNAEAFVAQLHAMPAGPEKDNIVAAYRYGFMGVFLVYLGIAVLALCLSLLIRHFDMNKKLTTDHQLADNRVSRMIEAAAVKRASHMSGATAVTRANRVSDMSAISSAGETAVEVEIVGAPRPAVLEVPKPSRFEVGPWEA